MARGLLIFIAGTISGASIIILRKIVKHGKALLEEDATLTTDEAAELAVLKWVEEEFGSDVVDKYFQRTACEIDDRVHEIADIIIDDVDYKIVDDDVELSEESVKKALDKHNIEVTEDTTIVIIGFYIHAKLTQELL